MMKKLMRIPLVVLLLAVGTIPVSAAEQHNFQKLFDAQIALLKDKGVSSQIVSMFEWQRDSVIKTASRMEIGKGNIPFLPIIPRILLSVKIQIAVITQNGEKGRSYLKPNLIKDMVATIDKPYYIFDVEDGEVTRDKSPAGAETLIKNVGRHALTIVEVISLALHTDVLLRHAMNITGSRYISANIVPNVWLIGGRVRLFFGREDYPHPRFGSPSRRSPGLLYGGGRPLNSSQ